MSLLVIKFGGHAMSDEHGTFSKAIASALKAGHSIVVVHGGGPQINTALAAAKIESTFIGGFRVTTPEIFEVVERVLAGEVGPSVAEALSQHGTPAQSLSGRSGVLFARTQVTLIDGAPADLGRVGEVVNTDTTQIQALIQEGVVPVISPIAQDVDSAAGLNVNADIAAAAIAGSISADELIIMTDVAGIYRHWPDKSSLITHITYSELNSIKETFTEGMAPKVKACLEAIEAGAQSVRIIDGTQAESFAESLAGRGGTKVEA